jgi:urease accessory protein
MHALETSSRVSENIQEQEPSVPNRLELSFTPDGDSTRMFILTQEPPWRAIRAFRNSQNQALVHLHNMSGGILAGDSLHLSIDAAPAVRVQVTSVGATRIYRQRPGRSVARLSTSIRVGEAAMLEYLPDAVIPFAGSRFVQSTTVLLGPNAGFIGWEILAAGRIASGEAFAFDSFHSECEVRSHVRSLALERYSLSPSDRDPRSVARWGRFRYATTLYVCHTGVAQPRWLDLEFHLNRLAMLHTTQYARWGASTLIANGLVVRGLGLEAHHMTSGLQMFWERAKQEIWGEPAVFPRKIN